MMHRLFFIRKSRLMVFFTQKLIFQSIFDTKQLENTLHTLINPSKALKNKNKKTHKPKTKIFTKLGSSFLGNLKVKKIPK